MTNEEFLDKVLPRTTMSKEEISEESADNAFSETEKSARNFGICGMVSSEASSNPISPAVYYGGATFNIKKHE